MNNQKIEVGTLTNYSVKNINAFTLSLILEKGSSKWKRKSGWNYNEQAIKNAEMKITKLAKNEIIKVAKGQNISTIMNKIAISAAEDYKMTIEKIKSPGNSEYTVMKKGFNNPLIDSGKWKNNISARINNGRIVGRG